MNHVCLVSAYPCFFRFRVSVLFVFPLLCVSVFVVSRGASPIIVFRPCCVFLLACLCICVFVFLCFCVSAFVFFCVCVFSCFRFACAFCVFKLYECFVLLCCCVLVFSCVCVSVGYTHHFYGAGSREDEPLCVLPNQRNGPEALPGTRLYARAHTRARALTNVGCGHRCGWQLRMFGRYGS